MKKAQITIFIVIAIILVAAILSLFILKRQIFPTSATGIPQELSPFAESYSSCLKLLGQDATQLIGQHAGYITLPEKDSGSSFMPFGNYLNFLGTNIPYWFYISGNNLEKQQIPTIGLMEQQIEEYVLENINDCDYIITEYSLQGFEIEKKATAKARASIKDDYISLTVTRPLNVKFQNIKAQVDIHNIEITEGLGKTYKIAKKIMDAENKELFLEQRTIDAIFLYEELPSTTTTLECNPQNYNILEVKDSAKEILANNIQFMKIKGTNYANANAYYEIDAGINDKNIGVNFLPLDNPFKLEVNGQEQGIVSGDSISQAYPAGLRNFLCLTYYNFVYTVAYPVLISVYDEKSDYNFQFPIIVYVNKNNPRKAVETEQISETQNKICEHKNAQETVYTFDSDAKPLGDVSIKYKCINAICPIGITSIQDNNSILQGNFPQCVGGFILAEKQGYVTQKEQISTNEDGLIINLILEQLKELDVELILINGLGGERTLKANENAIITFNENDKEIAETLLYPENSKVNIADGFYDVRIDVFKEGKLELGKQVSEKCYSVPSSGLGGLAGIFGIKQEKCETFEFPETEINEILFAGTQFSFHAQVKGKNKLTIYAIENPIPKTIDDLNEIYYDIALNKDSPLFKEPVLS